MQALVSYDDGLHAKSDPRKWAYAAGYWDHKHTCDYTQTHSCVNFDTNCTSRASIKNKELFWTPSVDSLSLDGIHVLHRAQHVSAYFDCANKVLRSQITSQYWLSCPMNLYATLSLHILNKCTDIGFWRKLFKLSFRFFSESWNENTAKCQKCIHVMFCLVHNHYKFINLEWAFYIESEEVIFHSNSLHCHVSAVALKNVFNKLEWPWSLTSDHQNIFSSASGPSEWFCQIWRISALVFVRNHIHKNKMDTWDKKLTNSLQQLAFGFSEHSFLGQLLSIMHRYISGPVPIVCDVNGNKYFGGESVWKTDWSENRKRNGNLSTGNGNEVYCYFWQVYPHVMH